MSPSSDLGWEGEGDRERKEGREGEREEEKLKRREGETERGREEERERENPLCKFRRGGGGVYLLLTRPGQ